MKTVAEMLDFINGKQYYDVAADFTNSVEQLVSILKDGEEVIFIAGSKSIQSSGKIICQYGTVIAITTERLIYAGKSSAPFARNIITKSVSVDFVSDVTKKYQTLARNCFITIDCRNETVCFFTSGTAMDELFNDLMKAIDVAKNPAPAQTVVQQVSAADELVKFKQLMDAGIITAEEFEAKKKQLLGL